MKSKEECMNSYVSKVLEETKKKNHNEPEYIQAIE